MTLLATAGAILLGVTVGYAAVAFWLLRTSDGQQRLFGTQGGGDLVVAGAVSSLILAIVATTLEKSWSFRYRAGALTPVFTVVQAVVLVLITTASIFGLHAVYGGLPVAGPDPDVPGCPHVAEVHLLPSTQECYGVLGLGAPPAVADAPAFGEDADGLAYWQRRILANNPAPGSEAVTAVWIGELACSRHRPGYPALCQSDDGEYDLEAELEDLQALRLAQWYWAGKGHPVRILLAHAGPHIDHITDLAAEVAALDQQHRLGEHRVVLNIGNSTSQSRAAIEGLVSGSRPIPVIAPTLTADRVPAPTGNDPPVSDRPFVDKPGYLQLAPTNSSMAGYALSSVPAGRLAQAPHLVIYRKLDSQDEYVNSLVSDLSKWDGHLWGRAGTRNRSVVEPGHLDASICSADTVVFFADRHFRFAGFVNEVQRTCQSSTFPLVMADGSANRVMNTRNGISPGPQWPLFYYASGLQCPELKKRADGAGPAAEEFLDALHTFSATQHGVPQPLPDCATTGQQIGDHVAPFWDAVTVALQLGYDPAHGSIAHLGKNIPLTSGNADIALGQVQLHDPPIPIVPLCADVADTTGSRSFQYCSTFMKPLTDEAFPLFNARL